MPLTEKGLQHHRWLLAAGCALILLLGSYAFASWPQSQLYGDIITHGPTDRPRIALTFDDGPNEPYTSQILDVLREKGVRATFFVVGANVEAMPDTVRRAAAEGHAIGNHSYAHAKGDALWDARYGDVRQTQRAIERILGAGATVYRSPSGFHTPWQLWAVRREGLTAVHWDVQTKDWERPDPETIVRRVLASAGPGAIVLMHDGDGTNHGTDRSPTVAALPEIIDQLQRRGYELVTVPELLGLPFLQPPRESSR